MYARPPHHRHPQPLPRAGEHGRFGGRHTAAGAARAAAAAQWSARVRALADQAARAVSYAPTPVDFDELGRILDRY